jgi:hypothetical protein
VKAPPSAVQRAGPITTDELSEIFTSILKRKGDQPPAPAELAALAAALTTMRFRFSNPDENIVMLDLSTQQRLALRPHGMPLPRRMIAHSKDFISNWHDLAPNMIAEFRQAMGSTNRRPFGNKTVARFLKRVVPRVTGETPAETTIVRWLAKPPPRKRPPKAPHP